VTPKAQVPLVARLFDKSVILLGFGVIIAVVAGQGAVSGSFDWPLLALIPVLAVLARFPVILRQRHIGLEIGLDCAVLAFLAMSATRADALLLWVSATVLVQMFASRNKALDVRLFNTALCAGAGTAALLTMWAVSPLGQTGPRETGAVLVGCLVYFLIDYGVTSVSIALDCRDKILPVLFTRALPLSLVGFLGVDSLGWLAAICLRYAPYGLPLVAIPFITVIAAMRTVATSNQERARLQMLFETSVAGHAAVTADDVEEVLLSRAVALLRCHSVQLVATPPDESAGEIGAHVSSGANGAAGHDQWLVASRRLTERPYDDVDRESLSTLAGVGAESLRRAELAAAMIRMARHDALTGLVNRSVLHEQFGQAVAQADERPSSIGVIYLDLDGFKSVNDSLGHEAGDELLLQVAHRLRAGVRTADTVARMGGDEFAVLVESVSAVDSVRATAHRLLEALSESFWIQGVRVQVSASVGYALRDESEDVSELLQRADMAMYTVKEQGKHGVAAFTPGMFHRHSARARLLQELREALVNDELRVHLQPVILLDSGRIDGVEALVRWQHPTRGLLGPATSSTWPRSPASSRNSACGCCGPAGATPRGWGDRSGGRSPWPSTWRRASWVGSRSSPPWPRFPPAAAFRLLSWR
jgi:diguanylate cyclase (GGDEF)-like protein